MKNKETCRVIINGKFGLSDVEIQKADPKNYQKARISVREYDSPHKNATEQFTRLATKFKKEILALGETEITILILMSESFRVCDSITMKASAIKIELLPTNSIQRADTDTIQNETNTPKKANKKTEQVDDISY